MRCNPIRSPPTITETTQPAGRPVTCTCGRHSLIAMDSPEKRAHHRGALLETALICRRRSLKCNLMQPAGRPVAIHIRRKRRQQSPRPIIGRGGRAPLTYCARRRATFTSNVALVNVRPDVYNWPDGGGPSAAAARATSGPARAPEAVRNRIIMQRLNISFCSRHRRRRRRKQRPRSLSPPSTCPDLSRL